MKYTRVEVLDMWLELSRQGMQTSWVGKILGGDRHMEVQEGDDRIA
jgi:hypothetical protein